MPAGTPAFLYLSPRTNHQISTETVIVLLWRRCAVPAYQARRAFAEFHFGQHPVSPACLRHTC